MELRYKKTVEVKTTDDEGKTIKYKYLFKGTDPSDCVSMTLTTEIKQEIGSGTVIELNLENKQTSI